ncbi:MAG: AAA family ATPase [Bacillota bacterium]|nr:MAG: hypothetical protein DIU70_01520 [Bacillota bacterium]
MRIATLELKDFRGHREFRAALGALNIIRGANGSGKTSVRHALEWLLTGRVVELTDAAGKGADEALIRGYGTLAGAKKAVVTATVSGYGLLSREVPNKLRGPGIAGGVREAEPELYRALGLPHKDLVTLALNPGWLTALDADRIRDLLTTVVTERMSRDEFLGIVEEWLGGYAETTAETADRALEWVKQAVPDRPGPGDIKRLYKAAYDARREANGRVRALRQQIDALQQSAVATEVDARPEQIPAIRDRLEQYWAEVNRLKLTIWEAEQAERLRAQAEAAVERARQELERVRRQTAEKGFSVQGDGRPGNAEAIRARLQTLAQQIRTIREQAGVCPVYAGVSCPLSPEVVQQHLAALEEQRQQLLQELAEVTVGNAVEALRQAEAARDAIVVPDVTAERRRLQNLQELIRADTDLLQRLAAAAGRAEGIAEAEAQLREAEAEAAMYDVLTKAFDEGAGIKALLLERRLGELQERINRALMEVMGADDWRVKLSADPEQVPIRISHPRHGAALLKTLSHAERTLVSLAILDALNDYHGLGLLAIDDAEHISGGNREYLLQVLQNWARSGRYGTILVLCADDTAPQDGVKVDVLVETQAGVGADA